MAIDHRRQAEREHRRTSNQITSEEAHMDSQYHALLAIHDELRGLRADVQALAERQEEKTDGRA